MAQRIKKSMIRFYGKYGRSSLDGQEKMLRGVAIYFVSAFTLSILSLIAAGALLFAYYSHSLPDFRPLKDRHINTYSVVYSEDDEVVAKFLMDNRIPIPYERIPKILVQAFVAAEDAGFFKHNGVEPKSIARATLKNLLAGRIVQGGSTITQQTVKTFFLTPKKSLLRKLKEVAFAFGLEKNLTKEQILFLYLNNIYLGNGTYGIEAASESYFNKRVEHLNLAEIAMLAGLVKAPGRYSPVSNLKEAKERQAYVLTRMLDLGFISKDEKDRALRLPLKVQPKEGALFSKAPYFSELIRQQVERKYGKEKIYHEGLRIYTTLNLSFQRAAQRSLEQGLRELDKRQGFRGPIRSLSSKEVRKLLSRKTDSLLPLRSGQLLEGVILSRDDQKSLYWVWVEGRKGVLPYSETSWATARSNLGIKEVKDLLKPGDVVHLRIKESSTEDQLPVFALEQEPLVQGALLSFDPHTGYVKAMVGGRDFTESQFNRAVSSKRQPGSVFKPFIYAAALEKGYAPSTILTDSPVRYANDDGTYWAPGNYDKKFKGEITFRDALAHSRNVVTVKILKDIGIGYALRFIKKFGIESPMKRNLSIALGTSEVSMLELTSAFCVFANGGERVKPIFIRKIVTMNGEVLEENGPYVETEEGDEEEEVPENPAPVQKERVLSPQNAFLMNDLLQDVVLSGTGQGAKVLGRPVAGKTGTAGDFTDAWFIGYTPSLLTSVWVGFDDKSSIGEDETGAQAALPIWVSFMRQALKDTPIEDFRYQEEITHVTDHIESGQPASNEQNNILGSFADQNRF
ncbi:MAG: penicillin-binding protein 1A [Thermodesulfobacteriota bacterium]